MKTTKLLSLSGLTLFGLITQFAASAENQILIKQKKGSNQVIISDSTFNPVDWAVYSSIGSGASETHEQKLTGGNLGSYRYMQHTVPPPPSVGDNVFIEVMHVLIKKTFDPSTQGAIEYIDYSEDNKLFKGGFVTGGVLIEQAGQYYRNVMPVILIMDTIWTSKNLFGLKASDFYEVTGSYEQPDFSTSGGPIEFGYWRSNNHLSPDPITEIYEHGLDNFSVTIHHGHIFNNPPDARDDYEAFEDNAFFVYPLFNDSDPDGDDISIVDVTQPANGKVAYSSNDIYFMADTNIIVEDYGYDYTYFTYTITDGEFFDTAYIILAEEICIYKDFQLNKISSRDVSSSAQSSKALQDTLDLDLLYDLRDSVMKHTMYGEQYVDNYYSFAPEILKIMIIEKPNLIEKLVAVTIQWQDNIRSLVNGDSSAMITQAQIDSLENLFSELSEFGSESLQTMITDELERIGSLDSLAGKTMKEISGTIFGDTLTVSIKQESKHNPTDFKLKQNYPNPFNSETKICFHISEKAQVILKIYNIHGQMIIKLLDKSCLPGEHEVVFDGKGLHSGMYIYRIEAGSFTDMKKLILIK